MVFGELHERFEKLKEKLREEGLFDEKYKKEIPFFPSTIGVVTSRTGAVIHDILNVTRRRNSSIDIRLFPVPVQGDDAAPKIAEAIEEFNKRNNVDVIIVGRGGGSLEDLWAFNEEIVVRAIFNSKIPIIAAVGHDTDVTLTNFVADRVAPTPSAAAEIAVPKLSDIKERLILLKRSFERHLESILAGSEAMAQEFPEKKNYKLNTIVIRATLTACNPDYQVSKGDIEFLTDYLFSVEEWGRYELWIFTNSVNLLTLETLETFASEMINRTQFYNNLPENRRRIIKMLLNVVGACIEDNHLQVAMKFLNYIDNTKIPDTDLYDRVLIKYHKALYSYKVGNPHARNDIEQCLSTFEYLDSFGVAQKLKEQFERIQLTVVADLQIE